MRNSHATQATAPISYELDGRQFVKVKDFLTCYPDASASAKAHFAHVLEVSGGDVEKRVEDSFLELLLSWCKGKPSALYSPIVFKDGWVIWVDGHHDQLLEALSAMFPKEQGCEESGWTSFLTSGHGWYISTQDPNTIYVSKKYVPSEEDGAIFAAFEIVQVI